MNANWTDDESWSEANEIEAGLAAVLGEHFDGASPEEIEQWVDKAASYLTPVESFDFGKALQKIGKSVGGQAGVRQFAGQALPFVGSAVGGMYGGPGGAAIGSQLGKAAGRAVAGSPSKPVSIGSTPAVQSPSGPMAEPIAQGTLVEPSAAGARAAGQLLHVVDHPAFLTSLLSLVMGAQGRQSVQVAGKEIPVAAFMNLVSTLAAQAAQGAQTGATLTAEEEIPSYLTDAEGNPLVDIVDPVERAGVLLKLLEEDVEQADLGDEIEEESASTEESKDSEDAACPELDLTPSEADS